MAGTFRTTKAVLPTAMLMFLLSAYGTAAPALIVRGSPPSGPASGFDVQVANIPGLGNILVGQDGMALYAFTKDAPGVSNCTGACATLWPPETIEPGQTPTSGPGVTAVVGSIILGDESAQVTINNMPVYNFSQDQFPGDAKGQGYKGFWYVLDPSGKMIKVIPATSSSAGGFDIQVAAIPGLGSVLVGEDGMTLYAFAKDAPGVSNCTGACATLWPPETIEPGQTPTSGPGVTAAVGSIIQGDEGSQITVNNMPVYNFSQDQFPGDAKGQGYNGFWYVLDPSGKMIRAAQK